MSSRAHIEPVTVDVADFLERHQDVMDFNHTDTPDVDGDDLSTVLDFNVMISGLSVHHLNDYLNGYCGAETVFCGNPVIPIAFDPAAVYIEPPVLRDFGVPEDLEPEVELVCLQPEIDN